MNGDNWAGTGWIHRLDLFTYLLHSQQEPQQTGALLSLRPPTLYDLFYAVI